MKAIARPIALIVAEESVKFIMLLHCDILRICRPNSVDGVHTSTVEENRTSNKVVVFLYHI